MRRHSWTWLPSGPQIEAGCAPFGSGAARSITADNWLTDTWTTAKEKRGEIVATFNNFQRKIPGDNRIDWILTRNIDAPAWIEINTCEKDGQFPSDHFPVIVEITLEEKK